MPTRITFVMQQTTAPADLTSAAPRTGGWTESWWRLGTVLSSATVIPALATKRALLLPKEGSITGFRLAVYQIQGNKLKPTGSSTGKFTYPGSPSRPCDVPQMALEMSGKTAGGPNASRFSLRAIPDQVIINGEYQPDSTYKGLVTAFSNLLVTDGWCFLGRDLTKPSESVVNIAGNVVTLSASVGGAVGDYLIFRRVKDDDDKPVKGSYRITAIAGAVYTLAASFPGAVLTAASGTARIDAVGLNAFSEVTPSGVVVKKVGRPFKAYRGRQSKR